MSKNTLTEIKTETVGKATLETRQVAVMEDISINLSGLTISDLAYNRQFLIQAIKAIEETNLYNSVEKDEVPRGDKLLIPNYLDSVLSIVQDVIDEMQVKFGSDR